MTGDLKGEAAAAGAAEGHVDDETRLRQLGYKQELRREFNLLRNFAVSFGLLSMLTGLGGFFYYGYSYGGPVVVVWGWIMVVTMTSTIALSMAEICSSLPTSGGVYFWAGVLGGKNGPLWAWIVGWYNLLGQVGITAGVEYTVVVFLQQLIATARQDLTFVFTPAQFFGVYMAFCLLHGSFNVVGTKLLGYLSLASVWWHVVGTLTIVIGLPIVAPTHQPASFVFGHYENYAYNKGETPSSGVSNTGFAFLLGLLLSQWAMVGYDSSAHIAEETKNAAMAGPLGLIMAIFASFTCGIMFLLSLCFSIQDPVLATYGTFEIIRGAFEARYGTYSGALGFMIIIFIASNFCGTFCITSNSRMLYAFARDDGIIGSKFWKQVNSKTGTPVNSIIFMVSAAILLGLTILGSTVVFTAIGKPSIGIIGLELSYIIPIFLRLTVAKKWFKKGPFHLGPLSYIIGWIGVAWGCFISVVLVLPTVYPVTVNNLNYAPVAVGSITIGALLGWFISAHKWFKGPVRNIDGGNKEAVLSQAYMHGELDESQSGYGNENGAAKE